MTIHYESRNYLWTPLKKFSKPWEKWRANRNSEKSKIRLQKARDLKKYHVPRD